jgi:hypothetical protein
MAKDEIFVIAILTTWLVLNICYSLFPGRLKQYIHRIDIFSLITSFQLFPGTPSRYKLFYCDQYKDKTISDWNELSLVVPFEWYQAFWFPQGQIHSNVYGTINDLVKFVKTKENTPAIDKIHERFIYKIIMNYALQYPKSESMTARRFKIVEETGIEKTKLTEIFVSDFQTI